MRLGRKLAAGVAEDVDEVPTAEESPETPQPVVEHELQREPQADGATARTSG